MALNFPNTPQVGDTFTSGSTTWQWTGSVWNIIGSVSNLDLPVNFSQVAVAGQATISADQVNDTLTFIAGSNINLSTNADTGSVSISSTASGGGGSVEQNLFETISADNGSVTASTANQILEIVGGNSIATSITDGVLTIAYSGSAIPSNSTDLNDIESASLTVDEYYLPAITRLNVSNVGASAYRFDQYGDDVDNPLIYALNGTTIAFKLNITGHPFLIQNAAGNNLSSGLVHVSESGTVSLNSNAQGKDSGTLYWKIPNSISGGYRYQCGVHAAMVGSITIKNFASI